MSHLLIVFFEGEAEADKAYEKQGACGCFPEDVVPVHSLLPFVKL
jgi:hypothetical protein